MVDDAARIDYSPIGKKMRFTLTTRNEFHDGWVAWVLGVRPDDKYGPVWLDGWNMAEETAGKNASSAGRGLMIEALQKTLESGYAHLDVEWTDAD